MLIGFDILDFVILLLLKVMARGLALDYCVLGTPNLCPDKSVGIHYLFDPVGSATTYGPDAVVRHYNVHLCAYLYFFFL
jgi:hypothetical protein